MDQVDMRKSQSECLRKTMKRYTKLFSHLINSTVKNSYAIYKMENEENPELSEFRPLFARELIEEDGSK